MHRIQSFRFARFPALFAVLALSLSSQLMATPFPQPKELKTDVSFWVRVYSQLETSQGVIHDARKLGIIYEQVSDLPPEATDERREIVKQHIEGYRERLLRLASSGGAALDAEDARILKIWKGRATAAELRRAADNVRFQSGQADRFREGLRRSGAWRPQIERMLVEANLPVELAALPHVESSFDPAAYSKVGAAGLWQLMPSTGRLYIRVDSRVDERFDPYAATTAAVAYFREAHERLGSWPLAVISYNHGVNGMLKAKKKLGTTDVVRVLRKYQSPSFRFASRNFYPSFLAALEVERNADELFGKLDVAAPWQTCIVPVASESSIQVIAGRTGHSLEQLRLFNPALRAAVWEGAATVPAGYALRLPARALPATQPVDWQTVAREGAVACDNCQCAGAPVQTVATVIP